MRVSFLKKNLMLRKNSFWEYKNTMSIAKGATALFIMKIPLRFEEEGPE